MAKYGEQARRLERREGKAQVASFQASLVWTPDPERETEETIEINPVGSRPEGQVSQRTVRYKGTNQVVEFAVTYSVVDSNGQWVEVLCIDTCNHGSIHRHRNGDHSVEPETIALVYSQSVLHDGLYAAIGEAYDAVEWGE